MSRFRALAVRLLSALGLLGRARRARTRLTGALRGTQRRVTRLWYRRRPVPDGMAVADVFHDTHWCPAVVDRTFRAVDAMAANLGLAAAIADGAGVPYSYVETPSRFRHRIAVPRTRHDDLIAAIAGTADPTLHLYGAANWEAGTDPWVAAPALGKRPPRRWRTDPILRVFRPRTDPAAAVVFGEQYGCEIEFWDDDARYLRAPSGNLTSVRIEVKEFGATETVVEGVRVRATPTESDLPLFTTPTFPVDLVYTWVDGSDPEWRRRKRQVTASLDPRSKPVDADLAARYENRDELRYSLRSVSQFADFVDHIYLVTDSQIPAWLDPTAPGLTVVDHREIFGDSGALPTFNSHAIESRLHHIEGLAEHYVYMNDDFLFGRLADPTLFFHLNGIAKFFTSTAVIAEEHLAVDHAANNARRLLEGRFGRRITNKMKHAPYPQRRSVNQAMEADFPEAFAATAANQLRSPSDIPVASAMSHYYGFFTQQAVPAAIVNAYVDIGAPDADQQLELIAELRTSDVICLNDSGTPVADPAARDRRIIAWLQRYYPVPSPWEK